MALISFGLTLFILQYRDYTATGGLWSLFETLGKYPNYNPNLLYVLRNRTDLSSPPRHMGTRLSHPYAHHPHNPELKDPLHGP